jgi:YidC/Oxa1 family membrane protein insertase
MVIQFPIWIALYQSVIQALAVTPQDLLGLSQHLYSWPVVNQALPVSGTFLWLNLAKADPYLLIPILVGVTMWVSQKMITAPTTDPQQQSMTKMMQWMMPLMFGFITLTLPSGLGLYFLVSNIFSIVVQYFIYGWGNVFRRAPAMQTSEPKAVVPGKHKAIIPSKQTSNISEGAKYGKSGSKRQDSGGSD